LLTHLSALNDSELLYEKGIYPQTSYIFRHALTREVVYDSILAKKKRELHAEIAKGIEELYKDSLADHYGALVEHFFTSENYAKAAEYSRIAGRKAQKAGSFKEAIEHARRRVICLERLPLTDEKQAKIIDARVLLADYLLNVNRFFEAKEVVVPIFDWAVQKNDQRCLPGIFVPLGAYYAFIEEEYSKGVEYLNEAKKVSEKAGDFLHLYFINFALGVIHSWYGGDFEKSIDHFEKAIFLSEMGKNLAGVSLMKGLMSAITHIYQGKVNLAYQVSQEAVLTAIEIGDALFLGRILAMHGVCCYFKGMFAEAEKFLLQGVNFCERTGNFDEKARAENWLALRYYDLGEYAKAQEYLQRCISTFELEGNTPSWANFQKLCVERIRIFRDDRDINLAELGTKFWKKNKLKVMEGHIARFIGEIFLNVDGCHFSDAESWITKAIEADGRNGTLWSLAGDFALYAGLFRRKGDAAKAKESLGKAIELFKKCGADGWVEKYEKELASIS